MVYRYPQFTSENDFDEVKYAIISCVKNLSALDLNRGSSGNVSFRTKKGFYITPSGIDPSNLKLDSIVEMDFDGKIVSGQNPSSEWKFHRDILKNKSQINAVIHTHSVFATAFSCLRVDMPSFHYMVAVAGGHNIKCSKYALFYMDMSAFISFLKEMIMKHLRCDKNYKIKFIDKIY
jgi:L-fuculose-phosphate aldolase